MDPLGEYTGNDGRGLPPTVDEELEEDFNVSIIRSVQIFLNDSLPGSKSPAVLESSPLEKIGDDDHSSTADPLNVEINYGDIKREEIKDDSVEGIATNGGEGCNSDVIKQEPQWEDEEIDIVDDHLDNLSKCPRKRVRELKVLLVKETEENLESGNGTVENKRYALRQANGEICCANQTPGNIAPGFELGGQSAKTEGSKYVNSELCENISKNNAKRIWDRRDYCTFCKKVVTNFIRHLSRKHCNKIEVRKMLLLAKRSQSRKDMCERLRRIGNHEYNAKCIREKDTSLIVPQQPINQLVSQYLQCQFCLSFFLKDSMNVHLKFCKEKGRSVNGEYTQSFCVSANSRVTTNENTTSVSDNGEQTQSIDASADTERGINKNTTLVSDIVENTQSIDTATNTRIGKNENTISVVQESSNELRLHHQNARQSAEAEGSQCETSKFSVNMSKNNSTRIWDRRDHCTFCKELVANFIRHLSRKHSDEVEVRKMLSLSKDSEIRRVMCERLRRKGNFEHNSKCIREKVSSSILVQRPVMKLDPQYLPCQFCLDFISKGFLHRHMKNCKKKRQFDNGENTQTSGASANTKVVTNKNITSVSDNIGSIQSVDAFANTSIVNNENTIAVSDNGENIQSMDAAANTGIVSNDNKIPAAEDFSIETGVNRQEASSSNVDLENQLFTYMRRHVLTAVIKEDSLIWEFGIRMLKVQKVSIPYCSKKLRELGKLKLELQSKISSRAKSGLQEFLDPDFYREVVQCAQTISGFQSLTGKFNRATAKSLCYSLRQCCEILECKGKISENETMQKKAKRFMQLLLLWQYDITVPYTSSKPHPKKTCLLPFSKTKCKEEIYRNQNQQANHPIKIKNAFSIVEDVSTKLGANSMDTQANVPIIKIENST